MNCYKMQIKAASTLGTLLAADTLFGHLCWFIRYSNDENTLIDFLDSYSQGEPAIIMSDPFPADNIPMPLLPKDVENKQFIEKITCHHRSELIGKLKGCPLPINITQEKLTQAEAFDIKKWLLKKRWLSLKAIEFLKEKLSMNSLLCYMVDNGCTKIQQPQESLVMHNTINRLSNSVEPGGLFFTQEYFIDPSCPPIYDIYIFTDVYNVRQLEELFKGCFELGYGKYKSRGKGALEFISIEQAALPEADGPNAVILLGPCLPAKSDPTDGFWQFNFKRGKLGGHWANGPGPDGEHNPFKYPLAMLKSGSVLLTNSPKPCYGRLADDVHPSISQVRHYGIAPALPVRIDQENLQ